MVLALDSGGHCPTDRVRVLRGKISGHGKQLAPNIVVHDRHLPALAHVTCIGETLTHQIYKAGIPKDKQALLR